MPIFKIHNFTRYNTDDISALLDSLEKVIFKQKKATTGTTQSYSQRLQYDRELHIVYFNPKDRRFKVSTGLRSSSPVLRLVKPECLYDNPMEALAATGGAFNVPASVVTDIAEELVSFYTTGSMAYNYRGKGSVLDAWIKRGVPNIQIVDVLQKRESKADKRLWAQKATASRALRKACWSIRATERNMLSLRAGLEGLEKVEKVLSTDQRALLGALRDLVSVYDEVETATTNVFPGDK